MNETSQGSFLLSLHIQPGAKRTELIGQYADALKIKLAAPPVDGKANVALIVFLAQQLKVPKSSVEIERGHSSRSKVVRIKQVDRAVMMTWVDSLVLPPSSNL